MFASGSIALKNLHHFKSRTVLLALLALLQTLCLFCAGSAYEGVQDGLERTRARLGADVIVYPQAAMSRLDAGAVLMQGSPAEVFREKRLLSKLASFGSIACVSYQLYIRDTYSHDPGLWICGFEPETDFVLTPWRETGSAALPEGTVLAGCNVPGDTVILFGRAYPVAARLEKTGSQLDESVYVSMTAMAQVLADAGACGRTGIPADPSAYWSAALIRTRPGAAQTVCDEINVHVRKVKALCGGKALSDASGSLLGQKGLAVFVILFAAVLLTAAVMLVRFVTLRERGKEMRVLRAAGASRRKAVAVPLSETLLVHVLSGLACVPLAVLTASLFGIRWGSALFFALCAFAASLLTGLLAAFAASLSALHHTRL